MFHGRDCARARLDSGSAFACGSDRPERVSGSTSRQSAGQARGGILMRRKAIGRHIWAAHSLPAAIPASLSAAMLSSSAIRQDKGQRQGQIQTRRHGARRLFDSCSHRPRSISLTTPGSLWVASGALADTTRDYKARTAGDLIMVCLNDSFNGEFTAGENSTKPRVQHKNRESPGFFGQLGPNNSLQNLSQRKLRHNA